MKTIPEYEELENRYNNAEAAKFLGVTAETLNQWRSQGKGPSYFKVGRYIQYTHQELCRWLMSQLRTHTSDQQVAQ